MSARIIAYRGIGLFAVACAAGVLAACSSSSEEATNNDPIAATFNCGGAKVETNFMYRRMALVIDGKAYGLHQAESASGARYIGSDGPRKIEFWNKGDEATLTFGERAYGACVKQ